MPRFHVAAYLDLTKTAHASLFKEEEEIWEVLPKIKGYLDANLKPGLHGRSVGTPYIGERVFIGEGTVVEHGAVIKGPAWIGKNCEIRAGAYIRENVIVGDGAVLGNSCEFKNSILFDGAQVPHYTYVGDSILGYKAHLGAGVTLSNFKLAGDEITIRVPGHESIKTGLRKFGAIVGDGAEVGSKTVLNPGSILGKGVVIYPGVVWSGVLAGNMIVKHRPQYELRLKRK
ncbi:transferase hexapeptide (six repeat-containing protein) [Verrucomicrobium sp. GAS474]|uniref:UDP-N-acetylglucosamine diphosphorylase n=1 Tax=Verrucomicrobium sp. GAS474 TaxID=1882831 RepID=UPI0008796A8F|nr:UDP-N-acetylglucosamine diphosphorylase [Verrucomicrobium sp. GAS474]SDU08640.1 transferase hexapeptide (six repeat-containing protein) [Verrucomicrobium sp. GAS474]